MWAQGLEEALQEMGLRWLSEGRHRSAQLGAAPWQHLHLHLHRLAQPLGQ